MIGRRARSRFALLLGGALALGARPALAQPTDEDIAKAKHLFEEGKALEDKNQWAEALDRFKAVTAIKTTPQVRFQIAYCEENLGHLVAAVRGYDEAIALAQKDEERGRDVIKAAPERLAGVKARVPHVTLDLMGPGVDKTHFAVLIDDAPVEGSSLHAPIELDAGSHAVELETVTSAGKNKTRVTDFTLAERESKTVRVEIPLVDETSAGSEPIKEPPPLEAPRSGSKVPAIVVGSVGIGSLIGAAVFLGLRQDTLSTLGDKCSMSTPPHCPRSLSGVADNGRTYTYASASLAVIGVAALGTATALWFTVGKSSPSKPAPASVVVSPSYVGVATRF